MPPRQTALIIQCEVGVNIGAEFNHLGLHFGTNKCVYLLQHHKAMMAKPMDLKASSCFYNSCGLSMESLKINASRFYGGQGLRANLRINVYVVRLFL
ncbi:hypothetical protein J5N97_026973 [Dioscorea zingiberensis]|uniref:Uncharacterized protein n=1 Tax=Dioscorea zingiberensis TaxID=325984 RepID=A0A9D5H793_9LILI|nr:hypothetical protein J5N97_026973 [Dioscorea zingiberensis]